MRAGRGRAAALALGLALAALAARAGESAGGPYVVTRHSIDGGGGRAAGGPFQLEATVGQHDAGPAPGGAMSGGSYELAGGFWPVADSVAGASRIFRDGFEAP